MNDVFLHLIESLNEDEKKTIYDFILSLLCDEEET